MPVMSPAQNQADGDERVGQILADQVEPEDVESQRQNDQDQHRDQRNADQFEPAWSRCDWRTWRTSGAYLLTLRANRPCGRSIRMPMTISSVSTLAIEPVRKNSSVDCDCEMVKRRGDGAEQALRAAEHHDQERIDDIKLAGGRPGRADHGEGAAGDAGDAAAEAEGERSIRRVSMPTAPAMVRFATTAAHLQAPARSEQQQRDAGGDQQRQAHDEQAVDLDFDRVGDLQRAHHPVRQFDADLARAEAGAEGLLHDQAQAPGREQRIERTLVEAAGSAPIRPAARPRRRR